MSAQTHDLARMQLPVRTAVPRSVLVSFIIPAHNEERLIGATIRAIHESAGLIDGRAASIDAPSPTGATRPSFEYEIIVADDASTDGTRAVAESLGARVVSHERRQIAATRNLGARAARGERLFFIDADTRVTSLALHAAMRALDSGAAGGGGTVRMDGRVPLYARVMLYFLTISFRLMRLTGGCFVFCRRETFEAAGGWDETMYAGEEIELAAALKRQGRFVIVPHPVITSGRKLRTHSAWEILGFLPKAMWHGPAMMRQREGLEIWYGPRRDDPALK
ncbi:MAG: glycosyltransferase [Phycisphaerales bacterium]